MRLKYKVKNRKIVREQQRCFLLWVKFYEKLPVFVCKTEIFIIITSRFSYPEHVTVEKANKTLCVWCNCASCYRLRRKTFQNNTHFTLKTYVDNKRHEKKGKVLKFYTRHRKSTTRNCVVKISVKNKIIKYEYTRKKEVFDFFILFTFYSFPLLLLKRLL